MELARRNAAAYASNPDVRTILLVGSVAKGHADDSSDIDMTVYYDRPLTREYYERVCESARESGGGVYHGSAEEGFAVYHYIDGIKCDSGHIGIEKGEEEFRALLDKTELDTNERILLSGFQDGVPLHGEAWFAEWKERMRDHPARLAPEIARAAIRFHPRWVLEKMGIERGETLFVYESLIQAADNIVTILCGVNRIYPPGKLKGMRWTIEKMSVAPERLADRLESLFGVDERTAVDDLYALIDETLDLVERHLPEVSTARAREVIGMKLGRLRMGD
jgi:hypothetical protein